MKRIIILCLHLMIFVGCSSSWPTKEKETFIEECVELNSSELFSSDQSPEDLCKCTMKEFSEQITWPDYNKILNGNLNKDEKAFFNNKVQVVLDKIVEKCKPAVLIN